MSTPLSSAEKWDHSIENALRKTSVGAAFGLPLSVVFGRGLAGRLAFVAFGAGIGAGMAYGEAKYLFSHGVTFDRRHVLTIDVMKPVE